MSEASNNNVTTKKKQQTTTINTTATQMNVVQQGVILKPDQDPLAATPMEDLTMPLLVNTVKDLEEVKLNQPDLDQIKEAYNEADFQLTDSQSKQKSRLKESEERYKLQESLKQIEDNKKNPTAAQPATQVKKKELTIEKAKDLSDEALIKNYGTYDGAQEYLDVRYALMRSKYFALLPVKDARKLSYKDLISRLKSQYEKDPRNDDLIEYYQTLVRLKNIEDSDGKEDITPPANPPVAITEKEREYNKSYLEKNKEKLFSLHISSVEKTKRLEAMSRVMESKKGHEFWADKGDDEVSPAQKEGARQILAWMYRNCNKSSESKEKFVYKLTQYSPGQLLLMFYLIESGQQSAPSPELIVKAKKDYTPDLDRFKDKVVASKWKFWKRLKTDSSDSVINWSMISSAARFAMGCDLMTDFEQQEKQENELAKERIKPENKSKDKQAEILYDILIQKGNRMLTLYKAAGVTPDMPPDMIKDKALQKEILKIINDFSVTFGDLQKVAGPVKKKEKKDYTKAKDKEKARGEDIEEEGESFWEKIEFGNTLVEAGMNVDTFLGVIGKPLEGLTEATGYVSTVRSIGAISALVGAISGIVSAVDTIKSFPSLTLADVTVRGLSASADIANSVNEIIVSGTEIAGKFVDLGEAVEESSKWIGQTTARTAADAFSTVSGGVQFVSGCVSIVTGAIQTGAGTLELARGWSSKSDIKRSRNKLKEMEKKEELTQDQKDLRMFLDHQSRVTTDQMISGGVKALGGMIAMVGGALTVSGVLAPLGGILAITGSLMSIGMGLIYARHARKVNQRQAVDDALKMDSIIELLKKDYPAIKGMSGGELDEIKDEARQEALAELGYSSYKEFFSDLSKKNAVMLYEHVFDPKYEKVDKDVFLDAIKSLGLKVKFATKPGEKNRPTLETIYSKLMA